MIHLMNLTKPKKRPPWTQAQGVAWIRIKRICRNCGSKYWHTEELSPYPLYCQPCATSLRLLEARATFLRNLDGYVMGEDNDIPF